MTINRETLDALRRELEAYSGGSIVKRATKLKIDEAHGVLFVGLGGQGCETVNALKSIYLKEYDHPGPVEFLAVDCDTDALRSLLVNEGGNGCLTNSEELCFFDECSEDLLINTPRWPEIESWIGGLAPVKLDGTGAQGVRQIGRVMLCGTDGYKQLRLTLKDKVNSLLDLGGRTKIDAVHAVIIASLSGGTGGGTFIDVSYMVRDILREMAWSSNLLAFQWGVFYTPEVQRHTPSIEESPDVWEVLKRNGYAALKELDYFMSNGSYAPDAEPIYKLSMPGGTRVSSAQPIFDSDCVFLVSGNGKLESRDALIKKVACSLSTTFLWDNSSTEPVINNPATALELAHRRGIFDLWRMNHVGISADGTRDGIGINNVEFPAFMNYQYLSLGYGSVYFPRDELMAYCGSEVVNRINAVWKDEERFNQRAVERCLAWAGLDSIYHVFKKAMQIVGITTSDLRIDKERDFLRCLQLRRIYLVGVA